MTSRDLKLATITGVECADVTLINLYYNNITIYKNSDIIIVYNKMLNILEVENTFVWIIDYVAKCDGDIIDATDIILYKICDIYNIDTDTIIKICFDLRTKYEKIF